MPEGKTDNRAASRSRTERRKREGEMINRFRDVQTSKQMKNALKAKPKQSKWLQSGESTLYLLRIGTDALNKIRLGLAQRLH